MLELFGTIFGNVLSLPGVLGLGLGMMTRSPVVAAVLGALVGIAEVMIFSGFSIANAGGLEIGVSILVGVIFAVIGSAIRRKGVIA